MTSSTCSCNNPFVANPSVTLCEAAPFQLVNFPPASLKIGGNGAQSQGDNFGSTITSARPVATSTYPKQSPHVRTSRAFDDSAANADDRSIAIRTSLAITAALLSSLTFVTRARRPFHQHP